MDRLLTIRDVQDVLRVGRSYAYKLVQIYNQANTQKVQFPR